MPDLPLHLLLPLPVPAMGWLALGPVMRVVRSGGVLADA